MRTVEERISSLFLAGNQRLTRGNNEYSLQHKAEYKASSSHGCLPNIKQSQAMEVAMGLVTHEKWGWLPKAITCFCA